MKHKYWCFFAGLLCLLNACSSLPPKEYEANIEDTVRGELSAAKVLRESKETNLELALSIIGSVLNHFGYHHLADVADFLIRDNIGDEIYDLHINKGLSFYEALSKIAMTQSGLNAEYAKQILEEYKNLNISIHDFRLLKNTPSTKEWQFVEGNSGVKFFFKINNEDSSTPSFDCFADIESLEHFIYNYSVDNYNESANGFDIIDKNQKI